MSVATLLALLADGGREFIGLALRVLPYLLLGAATAAAVQAYVSPRWTARALGGGARSVWLATVAAAVMPGCACASAPMAGALRRQGARLGTVTAFLMMSPLLAPQTLVLTWGVLGWRFAVARVAVPFLFIPALGLILNALEGRPGWTAPAVAPIAGGAPEVAVAPLTVYAAAAVRPARAPFRVLLVEALRPLWKPFLIGVAIAAALTTVLPEDTIAKTVGASGALAFVVAALLGIPFYVCEGEEVPLTLAATHLGLGPGPALTFMLGAVGTCIPTMLMARQMLGRRATYVYAGAWFVLAIGAGVVFGRTM